MRSNGTPSASQTRGVVYTPPALTKFVVDRAVASAPCLRERRWLDPACGDGAFLVEIVRRLAAEVPPDELPALVEARVRGVDIDPVACGRAQQAVVSLVEQIAGRQRTGYFNGNVAAADFLSLEPTREWSADLIVGNPPYVSATHLSSEQKSRFLERFRTAWGRLDLYALFIEHSLRFLSSRGRLAFVTPDKWLTAASSSRLRAYVSTAFRVRSIDRFDRHDLFAGVATVPCVTVLETPDSPQARVWDEAEYGWWDVDAKGVPKRVGRPEPLALTGDGEGWSAPTRPRGAAAAQSAVRLKDLIERVSVGVATGLNRCYMLDQVQAQGIEPELLRPVARGRDIRAGSIDALERHMLVPYLFDEAGGNPRLIDLTEFPGARAHLDTYRPALEQRHCVRVWGKPWYDLHDPVVEDLARRPKIVLPDVAHTPRFAVDDGSVLPSHSAYYLLPKRGLELSLHDLARALNSAEVAAELRRTAPTAKSGYRRFRAQVLREVHVPLTKDVSVASAA